MRRIYKTTTAIVTCMALAAPQFALAQEQQNGEMPEQLILPQAEGGEAQALEQQPVEAANEAASEAASEVAAEAPAAPAETPAEQVEAQPAAETTEPPAPPAAPEQEQAQPEAQPQGDQPAAVEPAPPAAAEVQPEQAETAPEAPVAPVAEQEPEAVAPASKPPVTQAEQPVEKPPVTQAESPVAKPADAAASAERTEKLATEAQKAPQPKPDSPQAVTTADPAPKVKPAAEAAPATVTGEPIGPDALRKKLEAEAATQGTQSDPAPVTDALPGTAPAAKTPDPQTAEAPAELPAPEMQAAPSAVAQRAAEQVAPATAAALSAGADQAQRQLDEVAITQENTRSSAEDFATSVMQGLQPGNATATTARDKGDDDDSKRDIAKMLLAGAAGFAVGKMLSNDREVALNTGDRVVVTLPDGSQQVIKDDNALLYRPGSNVQTETFQDGSTRTTVLREDGSRVVTIRDADMNTLRRTLIRADGSETQLIDDTTAEPVRVSTLPAPPPVEVIRRPLDEDALREALRRETAVDRRFSLGQVRDIPEVRALVAPVNVPEVTFDTGSAAITPDQARQLATLGKVIRDSIDQNPREIYMIEGYTDAVGSNAANLALSDRRAESVALALTEYFQVPPENMVVQGYGEQFLLVPTDGPERQNRRVAVRRITQLLAAN